MALLDTVKKHPYLTALGVFAVGLILVLALSGGKSEGGGGQQVIVPPSNDNANAINGALMQAQIAGQVQALSIDAAKSVEQGKTDASVTLGRLQIEGMNNQNILAAAVAYSGQKATIVIEDTRAKRDVEIANIKAAAGLAMNAQNVSVQQSIANQNYQLGLNQIMSSERLGAATLGTQAGIELAKIGSNERLGAAAMNIGAAYGAGITSSITSTRIGL